MPPNTQVQIGPDGQPIQPAYASLRNADGTLNQAYSAKPGDNLYDTAIALDNVKLTALPQLSNYANSTSPSPWAQVATQQQKLGEAQQKDQAQNSGAQAAASAWNQLAMNGGVSGGQTERIVNSSALNTANNAATIGAQGQAARLGITATDDQNKLSTLQALPSQQLAEANLLGQAKERDINQTNATNNLNLGTLIGDVQGQNAYNSNTYNQQMQAWGANKTAQAQAASSGGGLTWICSVVSIKNPFTKKEWKTLASAKEYCKTAAPEAYEWYFGKNGRKLVYKMSDDGFEFQTLYPEILSVIKRIDSGDMDGGMKQYWDMVEVLADEYYKDGGMPFYKMERKIAS